MYGISIEDPTIVGIINRTQIAVFACRNANCQDYNQATYLSLKNATFGRSIATTLTADSSLAILYTKTKPGGSYELILDVCRDPLCAIPGSSVTVGNFTTDVDLWLGFDVNRNVPLIVVSDPHSQTLRSYSCNARLECRSFPKPLINSAVNSFSISPYQTKDKKSKYHTQNFLLTTAFASTMSSNISTYQCASDLSSCSPPTVYAVSNVPNIITSVSAITTGNGAQQIAYTTFESASKTATIYRAAVCKVNSPCAPQNISKDSFTLDFQPDETFTLTAQMLCSSDSGCTGIGLAANAFNPEATTFASSGMHAINKAGKTFEIATKTPGVAKYHKPPPKVTIALFVLAGIAVASTILIVAWRIWVGRPPKPGYTQIN